MKNKKIKKTLKKLKLGCKVVEDRLFNRNVVLCFDKIPKRKVVYTIQKELNNQGYNILSGWKTISIFSKKRKKI